MRRALFMALVGLAAVAANADEPKITAPLPRKDIERIFKVMAGVTPERILSVYSVIAHEPMPGAIAQDTTVLHPDGTSSPMTVYARVDLVVVLTANGKELPMSYKLQKIGGTWKIISKARLID